MKLFLISQSTNTGYDTYDSAVVRAKDEAAARKIHPGTDKDSPPGYWDSSTWVPGPEHVEVELIGTCRGGQPGVICASFNAG